MSDEFRFTTAHRSPLTALPSRFAFAAVAATAAAIAAAAITAATTTATAAVATTTAATAAATIFTRSGFVDVQGASLVFLAIEMSDRCFRLFLGSHFDKPKAA